MFNDLRDFIKEAEHSGQVNRVEGADWNLEIGNITELQLSVPDAPLLLFDNIKGYTSGYRVITNFLNTDLQLNLIFGFPLETKGLELVKLLRNKLKNEAKPLPPRELETGPVMENIHLNSEVNLYEFPVPKWHEKDGGRYIGTGDLVIQKDPDEGWINLGTYRVQVQDKNTATIFISPAKHGDIIRRKYWDRGQNCPVAVVCGVEPLTWMAGYTTLPWGYSEYDYIGMLRQEPIQIVRGRTTSLPIPATAEIVLEGELLVPGSDDRLEGPFAEYTGYYASGARNEPAFRVNCIMHRNDPIIMGHPPEVGKYRQEIRSISNAATLWNELDKHVPGIKGVWFLHEATGLSIAAISLKQMYAGHAKTTGLCAAGLLSETEACRYIIMVDEDIDPSNTADILWALGQRSDPAISLDIITGLSTNQLNTMVPPDMRNKRNYNHSRAIVLACKPYDWIKDFPVTIRSNPEVMKKTKEKWGKFLSGQAYISNDK